MSNLELELSTLSEAIERLIHAINVLTSDLEDQFMTEFSEAELDAIPDGQTTGIATPIDPPVEKISSTNQKTIELIELSKRMGVPYLLNDDGKLIVDNGVLNEYNRIHLGDGV